MKQLTVIWILNATLISLSQNFLCAQSSDHRVTDAQSTDNKSTHWWSATAQTQLLGAGSNQAELSKALRQVKYEQRRAMEFLIENMPLNDLKSLSADFLLQNVELAYEAVNGFPWGNTVPEEIFFNDILPYANVDETREPWRAEMLQRCRGIVADCMTGAEAAQRLNEKLFPTINVRYSTSRRKANQSPSESIDQSQASCTGLSILLVDACRSVGVPARVVGIPSWTNKRGNHTWVEIWDREWHFTGACEPSKAGLNDAWFAHDASLADASNPRHRIYAASFRRTDTSFPLVWSPRNQNVFAVDVTSRYARPVKETGQNVARVLVVVLTENQQRVPCAVRITRRESSDAAQVGVSKGETADTNDFLTFELKTGHFDVVIEHAGQEHRYEQSLTETTQQLWEFKLPVKSAQDRADSQR